MNIEIFSPYKGYDAYNLLSILANHTGIIRVAIFVSPVISLRNFGM